MVIRQAIQRSCHLDKGVLLVQAIHQAVLLHPSRSRWFPSPQAGSRFLRLPQEKKLGRILLSQDFKEPEQRCRRLFPATFGSQMAALFQSWIIIVICAARETRKRKRKMV